LIVAILLVENKKYCGGYKIVSRMILRLSGFGSAFVRLKVNLGFSLAPSP
jgi:hypothetical protein